MKIATIIFAYNRSKHLKQVLEALSKNTVLPEVLYIFQDGLKSDEHLEEWKKVNTLISDVSFCEKEIIVASENKGLTKSIIDGISFVLNRFDAAIILEDDCVPMPDFMSFMYFSLRTYYRFEKVWSISGYAYPVQLQNDEKSAYFTGRSCSWGWGTWKDRWEKYSLKSSFYWHMINQDTEFSKYVLTYGNDLYYMLKELEQNKLDTWDVDWCMLIMQNRGLCLNPYKSLVLNIGHDNSGVHCGKTEAFLCEEDHEINHVWKLPMDCIILNDTKKEYIRKYGFMRKEKNDKNLDAYIYGIGDCFRENVQKISDKYNIIALIDRNFSGMYAGIPIIHPEKNLIDAQKYIIITIFNTHVCNLVKEYLVGALGFQKNRILLWNEVIKENTDV